MGMQYIRNYYGVPAKRGGLVDVVGDEGMKFRGVITGSKDARLRVRLVCGKRSHLYHPTHHLEYVTPNDKVSGRARTANNLTTLSRLCFTAGLECR